MKNDIYVYDSREDRSGIISRMDKASEQGVLQLKSIYFNMTLFQSMIS